MKYIQYRSKEFKELKGESWNADTYLNGHLILIKKILKISRDKWLLK